ncbi:hypothetical protein LJ739_14310 [Aestuariibacter halophilus]|uniref:Solute-binding protein family 3/N-terminal domain-containing protein n=1 Tax=Fluctibacter halophilus TaxID=226011 RepID=A0ABS8GA10_9ALTE|nr:hypothetical protein [Aestuariibacter halophilus]MCC2617422.1 hypothetical protein [Aestuariibacter halophilus]
MTALARLWLFVVLLVVGLTARGEPFPTFRVVTEILEPMQQFDGETLTGTNVEFIREVFADAGLTLPQIEVYPWVRAYDIALKTPNVFIFAMVRNQSREPLFEWVGPMATSHFALYGRKDNPSLQIDSLEDAKQLTISLMKNDAAYLYFRDHGFVEGENLMAVTDRDVASALFFAGRLEVIVSSAWLIEQEAKVHNVTPGLYEPKLLLPDLDVTFYLAASQGTDPRLIEALKRVWPADRLQY